MSKLQKWFYAFGNIGATVSTQTISTYIQFFYLDFMRLQPWLMGPVMVLYTAWNAINDPLAGAISDRTRTRWGRRVPYILFGTLPMALFFVSLWMPPPAVAANQILLFSYLLLLLFLYDALNTIIGLNYTALFPEMFSSLAERAEVSPMRQLFSILGAIVGIALPPVLYASLGWGAMGFLLGALTAISFLTSLKGTRERVIPASEKALPIRAAISATFRNYSFLTYLGMQLMQQFAFFLILAAIPFYAKYVLRVEEGITSLLLTASFATAIPMVFVWGRVVVRIGARSAMMAALAAFAVTLLPFLSVRDVSATLITTAGVGIALGGLMILPDILLADVIDEDEHTTGRRREGMYFGMQGLLIRSSVFLQIMALNLTLGLTGYNANLGIELQPPALEAGLRACVSLVPIAGLAVAILCMWLYPLHGSRLAQVREAQVRAIDQT